MPSGTKNSKTGSNLIDGSGVVQWKANTKPVMLQQCYDEAHDIILTLIKSSDVDIDSPDLIQRMDNYLAVRAKVGEM